MEYQNISPINREEAEKIFNSKDAEKICDAMVSVAFFEPNWKWAQDKFLSFLSNNDPLISGLAATCLGHLARIHRQIEKNKVVEALKDRLKDKRIAGRIEDALSDINIFT
jgi:hypothetical protein